MLSEDGNGGVEGDSRYEDLAGANTSIRNRKDEIKRSLLGEDGSENIIENRIERAIMDDQNHTELLTSTISAFGPNSNIYQETGWRILCAEPLWEVDPSLSNPDAIIGHPDRDMLISVECKTGLSKPQSALKQIRNAANELIQRQDYIEEKTTIGFETVERVLCVSGRITDRAREAMDKEVEEQGGEGDLPPIYLWKFHRFKRENLQLHTDFENRSSRTSEHFNRVSEFLGDGGIDVAECPLLSGSFYPESEIYNIIGKVMFDVLLERQKHDFSTRRFTRGEVKQEINTPRVIPHYEIEPIAEEHTSRIISDFLEYNLIQEIDPSEEDHGKETDLFEIRSKVGGKKPKTIRKNLQQVYKANWIDKIAEEEARKQVVEEFEETQAGIDDYLDD